MCALYAVYGIDKIFSTAAISICVPSHVFLNIRYHNPWACLLVFLLSFSWKHFLILYTDFVCFFAATLISFGLASHIKMKIEFITMELYI